MKVLIASANGYGNAGDDICAESARAIVRKVYPRAVIRVTAPPFDEELAEWSDVIMLGGGGIIYDANKDNMENYLAYIDYGLKNNKKTIGLGLGEQGIVTKEGEKRYKKAFNAMDLVTVRSTLDLKRLKKFGVEDDVKATQDLAVSYNYKPYLRYRTLYKRFKKSAKPKLAVTLSNQEHLVNDLKLAFSPDEKKNALQFKKLFEKQLSKLAERYDLTVVVQSRDDREMADGYAEKYGVSVHHYKTRKDLPKLLRFYARQDLVVTQRFHGLIFSLMMGVPVITLGYHGQKQFKLLYDLFLNTKLLMYHEPKNIQAMLTALTSGDTKTLDDWTIHESPTKQLILRDVAQGNARWLNSVLHDVDESKDGYLWKHSAWGLRYEVIANMFPKNRKVMDIGAGEQFIKDWIEPKKYYGLDIAKRTPDTIVIDLEKEKLPKLDVDIILAQGLFEYLTNAEEVMSDLHEHADEMITTGFFRKEKFEEWNRHFTEESFEKALKEADWEIVEKEKVPRLPQYVYRLKSTR